MSQITDTSAASDVIRNQQVAGSKPAAGSIFRINNLRSVFRLLFRVHLGHQGAYQGAYPSDSGAPCDTTGTSSGQPEATSSPRDGRPSAYWLGRTSGTPSAGLVVLAESLSSRHGGRALAQGAPASTHGQTGLDSERTTRPNAQSGGDLVSPHTRPNTSAETGGWPETAIRILRNFSQALSGILPYLRLRKKPTACLQPFTDDLDTAERVEELTRRIRG